MPETTLYICDKTTGLDEGVPCKRPVEANGKSLCVEVTMSEVAFNGDNLEASPDPKVAETLMFCDRLHANFHLRRLLESHFMSDSDAQQGTEPEDD